MDVGTWFDTLIPVAMTEARVALLPLIRVSTVPAGQVLAYEGDPASTLRWVIDGRIEAYKEASDGRQVPIHAASAPYVVCGGISDRWRQPLTLIARTAVVVVVIGAEKYENWAHSYPEAALCLMGGAMQASYQTWAAVTSRLADDLAFAEPQMALA